MTDPELRPRTKWKERFIHTWLRWERLFAKLYGIEEMPGSDMSMFRVSRRSYPGADLTLPDGSILHHGDPTAEIHFNNEYLMQVNRIASETRMGIAIIRGARTSFARLAKYILSNRKYDDVKAIWGITLLYRGADKFGFAFGEPYSWRSKLWLKLYLPILLRIFHPDGGKRLHQRSELLKPKMVYVSRGSFLDHFRSEQQKQ